MWWTAPAYGIRCAKMGPLSDPSEEPSTMTTITTIGLYIAKSSFAAHCADASGKAMKKAQLRRSQVRSFLAEQAPCQVGLEACGSAHHWAREIDKLDHEVRLVPAGRAKGFVLRQKNDAADARAITGHRKPITVSYFPYFRLTLNQR
jgi:transposase